MGQISVEIYNPPGSTLSDNQQPDLHFRNIHDQNGTTRLEFSVYWREDNDNPALQRFFTLINERYPV